MMLPFALLLSVMDMAVQPQQISPSLPQPSEQHVVWRQGSDTKGVSVMQLQLLFNRTHLLFLLLRSHHKVGDLVLTVLRWLGAAPATRPERCKPLRRWRL